MGPDMRDRKFLLATLRGLASRGWLGPMVALERSSNSFLRTSYIGIALNSGLLAALGHRWMNATALAGQLGIDLQMRDEFVEWLRAGVQLGVLAERGGRYRIRRRDVRALLRPQLAPIAAFYEELVYIDLPVLQQTPDRLASGALFEIADANPAIVARASRLGEPFIASALLAVIIPGAPQRLLEIGCGTGVHIQAAAELNPQLTAVGIDLSSDVAALARTNLAAAGLADRVEIEVGDALDRPAAGEFDLVTMHQNIYYFTESGRVDILRRLGGQLRAGGQLLVTTLVRDAGPSAAALNLWGAMTKGASRLPLAKELAADFEAAGYQDVRVLALDGLGLYSAVVGRRALA